MRSFGTLARAPTPTISPGAGGAKVTDDVEVDFDEVETVDDIVCGFTLGDVDVDLVAVCGGDFFGGTPLPALSLEICSSYSMPHELACKSTSSWS